jgi:hypothetical protein
MPTGGDSHLDWSENRQIVRRWGISLDKNAEILLFCCMAMLLVVVCPDPSAPRIDTRHKTMSYNDSGFPLKSNLACGASRKPDDFRSIYLDPVPFDACVLSSANWVMALL